MPSAFEDVRIVLRRHPEVTLAIVFGSVGTGTVRKDSDLDLAVASDKRPLTATEKAALIRDLAEATGRAVDLIDLATAGEPLLGEILCHGQRLTGTDPAFAELLIRHLDQQADLLPYRQRILAERRRAWIGD